MACKSYQSAIVVPTPRLYCLQVESVLIVTDRDYHNYMPQNQEIVEFYEAQERRSTDFVALKLRKGPSGITIYLSFSPPFVN